MNWSMLGHEWAVSLLRSHLVHDSPRHAYLITGPPGIGRRTLALHFAQALNCPTPIAPGEACLQCRTCQQIERMQHPDLAVVQAEWKGGTLKVEQVRDLQHTLALTPYEARYRVALLLRFEEAHPSAANALLKTLEEPAPQVILLLTAESAESLLPTIVSRCEVLRLRPLPLQTIQDGLNKQWGLKDEDARLLAHLSDGRPGYALQLHQNPEKLEKRKEWLEQQRQLMSANRVERFAFAEAKAHFKDKDDKIARLADLKEMLLTWRSLWRDALLCASGASAPLANLDRSEEVQALAGRLDLLTIYQMVSNLERTLAQLEKNVNPQLALEVLLLGLP
jgi:DNA polymerase-3 subunit delta'